MKLHKLLKRQLERLNIDLDNKPETNEQWANFIQRINNTYYDVDQERYLLERSMNISSREMMGLNEKLEFAQHIAGLGYWYYDGMTERVIWSKELFNLFHLDSREKPPMLNQFLEFVHEQDRFELVDKIERALEKKLIMNVRSA